MKNVNVHTRKNVIAIKTDIVMHTAMSRSRTTHRILSCACARANAHHLLPLASFYSIFKINRTPGPLFSAQSISNYHRSRTCLQLQNSLNIFKLFAASRELSNLRPVRPCQGINQTFFVQFYRRFMNMTCRFYATSLQVIH